MVRKMKKIERRIKKAAERMLPDSKVKESIRNELYGDRVFAEVAEPVVVAESAGNNVSSRVGMRKKATVLVACLLIACLAVGLVCYFMLAQSPVPVSGTYVSIKINPAFGIEADENDVVTEVTALNTDAVVVLYGMNLVGKPLTQVVDEIVAECAALGFLDTTDAGSMEVIAANTNGSKEASVISSILTSLGNMFGRNGWGTGVHSANCTNPNCTGDCLHNGSCQNSINSSAQQNRYQHRYGQNKNNVSPGKSIMATLASERSGMSYGKCVQLSVADLCKLIAGYDADKITATESALEESYNNNPVIGGTVNKLQAMREECKHFIESMERVIEFLEDRDGRLSAQDIDTIHDILTYDYSYLPFLDLSGLLEMVAEWWNDLDELCEQFEDILDEIVEIYEEEADKFFNELSEEMNDWKKDFLEEIYD